MGLSTIDPRSQREHTEIHKISAIPKFDSDLKTLKKLKINKEKYCHPDAGSDSVRIAIYFSNGYMLQTVFPREMMTCANELRKS